MHDWAGRFASVLRFWNCTPIGLALLDKFRRILWQSFVFSCFGALPDQATAFDPMVDRVISRSLAF
jgi:hypothetical protein